MFAVILLISLHGVLSTCASDGTLGQLWVRLPEFQLCCDLAPSQVHGEREGHTGSCCMTDSNNQVMWTPPPAQCHLSAHIIVQILPSKTPSHEDICLDVFCWVAETLGQLDCNLRQSGRHLDAQAVIAANWTCLDNMTGDEDDRTVEETCQGDEAIKCSMPLYTDNQMILVTLAVSSGRRSAVSPVIVFIPQHLVELDPPVNLQYNMTTEGELLLSWTDPHPTTYPLTYDLRYSFNSTLSSWMHLDGVTAQPVSMRSLAVGTHYLVQVRRKIRDRPSPWSDWSQALPIYLHEVTYLPETMLTSAGSNVTVYCVINNRSLSARNVVWWLDAQERVPESQYSVISEHVSSVTLLNVRPVKEHRFRLLQCCQWKGNTSVCSYSYAALYIKEINVAVSCETNGDLTAMTCRWNTTKWVKFLYRIRDLPCDVEGVEVGLSPAKECPTAGQGFMRCTLQPVLPVACYRIWLEFGKEGSPVKSLSIWITPMEWVKPYPPYDLLAITVPEGFLIMQWKRHELPVYELQFEVRYTVDRPDARWKVLGLLLNQSVVTPVLEPCSVYVVRVRCMRYGGPGIWSDWSDPYRTQVHNSKAPEIGPDFWRFFQKDPSKNETNVTLLFAHLKEDNLSCCVEGFTIQHHASKGLVWFEKLSLVSSHTFLWTGEVHTITATAWNSQGSSTKNHNMTLIWPTRRAKLVSFFNAVRINGSCFSLTWTLIHNRSDLLSFVVEWRDQSTGDGIKWARIPAHSHTFYLHDSFFSSEEYSFTMYPIFADGEGEPAYTKENRGHPRGQHTAYVLLLIVAFLSVTLFLILVVSQQQMMKLVWRDVPDPNNCSWAQGVDFNKAESLENLFRHREKLTSCPLLLELDTISEAVIVERTKSPASGGERDRALGWAGKSEKTPRLQHCGNFSGIGAASAICASMESLNQSRVAYGSVLSPQEPSCRCGQDSGLSGSLDEGNFSVNSDMSSSSLGVPWGLDSIPSHQCSCSFDSTEEFSESSDQEDESLEGSAFGVELALEDHQGGTCQRQAVMVRCKERCERSPLESVPLLSCEGSRSSARGASANTISVYMPQFQTLSSKLPRAQDSFPQV
uniref:Leptin receptor n=1 Tax=Scleropages formosus TaxID=113540 RepID=A0A8C9RWJ7_SCLFO